MLIRVRYGEQIMNKAIFQTIILGSFIALSASAQEGKIAQRKENQQARIAQGVKSGQLTAGETANLEKKEAGLNKEIRTERKANGLSLTNNEKKQVNRQQNKIGKKIYDEKHNAAVQPR